MEILYVMIYLAIISRSLCFNFGSVMKTLPPEFPEEFKNKILDMYAKHPDIFGDTVTKQPHSKKTKMPKIHQGPNALRMDEKTSEKPVTTMPEKESTTQPTPFPMLPMQIPPMPVPIPVPVPMYPQMPIVLPMRTYYERVIHQHPPLEKIKEIIKEDELKWEKYATEKYNYKPNSAADSDSYDTDDNDSRRFDHWHYYNDFLHIKG